MKDTVSACYFTVYYYEIQSDNVYLTVHRFRPSPGLKMGTVKDFYEFLVEAELQHYYNAFKNELKVSDALVRKLLVPDIGTSRYLTMVPVGT